MSTPLEMLQEAALALASNGTVKDRLLAAYCTHLAALDEDQLPKEYREEFAQMCRALHRERPLPRENAVRASVRKMSNDEAHAYAALLVRLYGAVARTNTPVRSRSAAGIAVTSLPAQITTPAFAPVVQLFAAAEA